MSKDGTTEFVKHSEKSSELTFDHLMKVSRSEQDREQTFLNVDIENHYDNFEKAPESEDNDSANTYDFFDGVYHVYYSLGKDYQCEYEYGSSTDLTNFGGKSFRWAVQNGDTKYTTDLVDGGHDLEYFQKGCRITDDLQRTSIQPVGKEYQFFENSFGFNTSNTAEHPSIFSEETPSYDVSGAISEGMAVLHDGYMGTVDQQIETNLEYSDDMYFKPIIMQKFKTETLKTAESGCTSLEEAQKPSSRSKSHLNDKIKEFTFCQTGDKTQIGNSNSILNNQQSTSTQDLDIQMWPCVYVHNAVVPLSNLDLLKMIGDRGDVEHLHSNQDCFQTESSPLVNSKNGQLLGKSLSCESVGNAVVKDENNAAFQTIKDPLDKIKMTPCIVTSSMIIPLSPSDLLEMVGNQIEDLTQESVEYCTETLPASNTISKSSIRSTTPVMKNQFHPRTCLNKDKKTIKEAPQRKRCATPVPWLNEQENKKFRKMTILRDCASSMVSWISYIQDKSSDNGEILTPDSLSPRLNTSSESFNKNNLTELSNMSKDNVTKWEKQKENGFFSQSHSQKDADLINSNGYYRNFHVTSPINKEFSEDYQVNSWQNTNSDIDMTENSYLSLAKSDSLTSGESQHQNIGGSETWYSRHSAFELYRQRMLEETNNADLTKSESTTNQHSLSMDTRSQDDESKPSSSENSCSSQEFQTISLSPTQDNNEDQICAGTKPEVPHQEESSYHNQEHETRPVASLNHTDIFSGLNGSQKNLRKANQKCSFDPNSKILFFAGVSSNNPVSHSSPSVSLLVHLFTGQTTSIKPKPTISNAGQDSKLSPLINSKDYLQIKGTYRLYGDKPLLVGSGNNRQKQVSEESTSKKEITGKKPRYKAKNRFPGSSKLLKICEKLKTSNKKAFS